MTSALTEPKLIRFLLVEDDDDHAALVQRTIRNNRIVNTVERVRDGAEALDRVRCTGAFEGEAPVDVVLLDLKLPKVDGHEVLAAIKEDPHLCMTPVVILTTSDAESDRARAYRNSANSYLVKPVDFERFRQLVKDLDVYWGVWNCPAPER